MTRGGAAGVVVACVAAGLGGACGACGRRASAPAPEPAAGSGSAAAAGSAAGAGSTAAAGSAAAAAADAARCTALPFATTTPVPEASAAAWWTLDGKPVLVVVSDSGDRGAYALVDADTGATLEQGALPLGEGASDDLEGLASHGDRLYGLTSSGWLRAWRRDGAGFALVDGPYPIGPVDPRLGGDGNRPPAGRGMVCAGPKVNCGRNYEGLALAAAPAPGAGGPRVGLAPPGLRGENPGPAPRLPTPTPGCAGFAAAKADGRLYCLVADGARYRIDPSRAIRVARPGALADCAFDDADRLWVGSNLFDLGNVYRVDGWRDPAHARVIEIGAFPVGFPEVIAVRGDLLYRMSDTGGAPSLMAKFRCPARAR